MTLMFDGYNEGWWLLALRQEVESTRGVLHIFSSYACCQLLVSGYIGHDFVLYQFFVVSCWLAVGCRLVFCFDSDCLIFLVLYVIDH